LKLRFMNTAVNLDNQPGRMAVEVHYEAIDNLLAAKVKTGKLAASKPLPQHGLVRRLLRPKPPRQLPLLVTMAISRRP
jgi:hypothetical protein